MLRVKQSTKNRFLLLYGSQTGQAKAIAEEIADTAPQFDLIPDLHCLSLTEKRFSIEQESCVVLVVSTAGEGEPPDNAVKFFRRIRKRTLDRNFLKNVRYALLALGDSNYSTFCHFGVKLEEALKSLSARSFYSTGYADDKFGIEKVAEPWIANLFPAIKQLLGLSTEGDSSSSSFKTDCHLFSDLVLELILSANCTKKTMSTRQVNGLVKSTDLIKSMASIQKEEQKGRNDSIYSLFSVVETLRTKELRTPPLPPAFLTISYLQEQKEDENVLLLKSINLVSAASPLVDVSLECAKRLTEGVDVKETLELTFKFMHESLSYQPGDSFGFLCKNSEEEVTALLERLGVQHLGSVPCKLSVAKEYSSKKKSVQHLPEYSTLRQIFTSYCDIRSVPKKILLRVLLEYATNEADKLCLQFLSSQEGAFLFVDYVRKPSLCLIDILHAFKSCIPPVERILEYLPALKPRFYSVASSPLVDSSLFRIIFNVVHISEGSGRCEARNGVCTGWLSKESQNLQASGAVESDLCELSSCMSSLSLKAEDKNFHVYKRQNYFFHFPDDLNVPVIMIGPGTGVAPFIGFLQHREQQMKSDSTRSYGETWLFYGCRYQKKDFLYREELTRLHSSNVLSHFITCFSRDESGSSEIFQPHYVQDNIKHHAQEIIRAVDSGGQIFVCGDAKRMAHDVYQAFVEIMETVKNCTNTEAHALIKNLEAKQRYVADVWT